VYSSREEENNVRIGGSMFEIRTEYIRNKNETGYRCGEETTIGKEKRFSALLNHLKFL
jgi:hypothetical protein